MKLRTNLAMHEVPTLSVHLLPSIGSLREYLDVYCADDEKWSDFGPIRPAAELRQFAARALRLIERAIMANFREGVWVAGHEG